ncbi:MAG: extracellular solute-binding protein [Spirochaetota bacterium]
MKKITTLIALSIFVSMALFGGGQDEQTQDPSTPASYSYHMQITASLTQVITNFGDTELARELAERTGVSPVYQHPLAGQEEESFNLMIAAGELPDIFEYNIVGNYPGGPEKAIDDGVVLDLTDLLPEYAPNLWQYYQDNPDVALLARTDTGRYYSFPFIRGDESLMVFFGPVVNRSWLNELGLDLPETIDDWEEMLTLFRDEMGAEAPLTYEPNLLNNANNTFVGAFGTAFDFFIDDNGDVQYGPIQPGYRDYLETFARWYDEGLLDVNIESMDRQQVAAKMTTGQSGASIGFAASRLGAWLEAVDGDPD